MKYRIMLLVGISKTRPLYTPYMVSINNELVEFETDDEVVAERAIDELRIQNPEQNIFLYNFIPYKSETIIGT